MNDEANKSPGLGPTPDACFRAALAVMEHFQYCHEEACECYALKKRAQQLGADNLKFGLHLIERNTFEKIFNEGMGTKEEK